MGFYAPAQIVADARKNGVTVREIDVSYSFAQNTLEERDGQYCAVRLGFRQIDGFSWTDPDEERIKKASSSFRDKALATSTSSFRDAPQGTGPDFILPIVVMDSGLALRAPRNDDGEIAIP